MHNIKEDFREIKSDIKNIRAFDNHSEKRTVNLEITTSHHERRANKLETGTSHENRPDDTSNGVILYDRDKKHTYVPENKLKPGIT